MEKDKDFEFNFYWNDGEEEAQPDEAAKPADAAPGFEDIVSDSRIEYVLRQSPYVEPDDPEDYEPLNRRYRKKRRGIAGVFQRIGDWWHGCKRWQRSVMIVAVCFTLLVGSALIWFFSNFSYRYRNITNNPDDLGFADVIDKDITNIALFGIDTRDEDSFDGLADSIMILSLNARTKTVKIISVLRDSLVPIERNGKVTYNKINSSYTGSGGGPELAIKTLNQNFGLDISEYATVNFYGMADIIEAVGGIDAELTDREVKARGVDNHGINDMIAEVCDYMDLDPNDYYIRTSGPQHLNGVQAVAYSRIRYVPNIWGTSDDYGRTDRQRYVMEQLFNQAVKLGKTQYISLAKALIPCTETSLSYSEIIGLAFGILLHSPTFEQERLPQVEYQMTAPSIKGVGSCVYYDLEFASVLINNFIYQDTAFADYVEQNGIQKNDWYRQRVGYSGGSSGGAASSGTSSGGGTTTTTVPPDDDTVSDNTSTEEPNNGDDGPGGESSGDSSGGESSDGGESSGDGSSDEPSGGESSGDSSGGDSSGNSSGDSSGNESSGGNSSDGGGENPDEDEAA